MSIQPIWTIQAKRQLRHGLADVLCTHSDQIGADCLRPVVDRMSEIDQILSCTFERAKAIVVHKLMSGFRNKSDVYVLLVEVEEDDQGGPRVVKVGRPRGIERELHGWDCCRPVGLRHDLVLLPLSKGCEWPADGECQWMSLVYGDAHQFIGVERTMSLEEAFLDAVCYGNPSLQSVGTVIVELLERLGHMLYATSFIEDPSFPGYVFRMPKVILGAKKWTTDPVYQSIRSDSNVLVNHGVSRFIDPVDYFEQWVFPSFHREERLEDGRTVVQPPDGGGVDGGGPAIPSSEVGVGAMESPQLQDLVPYMLRGCAHGDLHGRNVWVGLVHDRALWPTVFDYEDMGPNNLCGWDFVKLEMELKIRAYRDLLSREEPRFLNAVRECEVELHELTEQCHQDGSWPAVEESNDPRKRLRAAMLEIRRMASIQLGKDHNRSRQWLEEYYFLLAAYGINVAYYGSMERRELIAAYVSAGVAASRLSWPRRRESVERRTLGLSPQGSCATHQLAAQDVLATKFVSYATPLEVARRWSQSNDQAERLQARELLRGLFKRFPHSIEIGQQLALAELEAGGEKEAITVLHDIQLLCRNPHEEVLSRCGRVYRDQGDRYVSYPEVPGAPEVRIGGTAEIPAEARRYYLLALREYTKAYQIRFGHYPGVNVATLHLLIAALDAGGAECDSHLKDCRDTARRLLDHKADWPREHDDDPIWHAASAGELHLLLKEWDTACECYRAAQQHQRFQRFHRTTMLRQVVRIVYGHKRLGVASLGPFDDLAKVSCDGTDDNAG
jgi:hypothetical protein